MAWRFEVERQLESMNGERRRQGRTPLSLKDVAFLTGIQYKSLLNLARNSTLRATNTRFIDALCAFFCCEPSQIMVRDPELRHDRPDHDEIDRLLEGAGRGEAPRAGFHVEVLYNDEAERHWRLTRAARGEQP